ncbi:MAG: hypothetical protein IPK32_24955 [Verrucomicrobiaceae bacterium]|nr:hypothetical protein [Verrucomicrobiaceae bacterium]
MKIILQVLLHALCAVAGFWLVGTPKPEFANKADAEAKKPKSKHSSDALISHSPPKVASEAGAALLTPENWAEAIHPISQMRLDELPAFMRGLLRNPFPDVRTRLMRYLFERWATLDLNGALTTLRSISSPELKERALWAVFELWTKTDTEAAWKWVNALEDDSVLQEAGIKHLLHLNTAKDPLASAAWADQIEDLFLREKALIRIGDSWMSNDAKGVLTALTSVEPKRLRDYLFSRVCYRDGIDHAAGLEIVSQLPSQAERSLLNEEWLTAFVMDHPQESFQWLRDHSDRAEFQKSASAVGSYLGTTIKSYAELRAMALQLPSGPLRDAFAAGAAGQWAYNGHLITEAQDLLSLCGPCIERDNGQDFIDSERTKP